MAIIEVSLEIHKEESERFVLPSVLNSVSQTHSIDILLLEEKPPAPNGD